MFQRQLRSERLLVKVNADNNAKPPDDSHGVACELHVAVAADGGDPYVVESSARPRYETAHQCPAEDGAHGHRRADEALQEDHGALAKCERHNAEGFAMSDAPQAQQTERVARRLKRNHHVRDLLGRDPLETPEQVDRLRHVDGALEAAATVGAGPAGRVIHVT